MVKWTRRGIGLTLMLCLFARLLWGALQLSATADEPSHITSGYVALSRGLAGLWTVAQRGHPPGVDSWLALPLWIAQPDVPLESLSGWQTDYPAFLDGFWASLATQSQTLFVARVQAMFFTLLLAAVSWRWGRELWGPWTGLLALGILAFDPTLIAHGRLATNDVGVTALGTWALYRTWRWMERPSWRRALGIGLLLALTMLAKASGVLWGIAAGVMMLVTVACQWRGRRWREGLGMRLLGQVVATALLALFLLWAAYGFSWGQLSGCALVRSTVGSGPLQTLGGFSRTSR